MLVGGEVHGDIDCAKSMVINGMVEGDVTAEVVYIPNGKVVGNVAAKSIYCSNVYGQILGEAIGDVLPYTGMHDARSLVEA